MTDISNEEERYDFIVVAAGSVLATELSASGTQVLVSESGTQSRALGPIVGVDIRHKSRYLLV